VVAACPQVLEAKLVQDKQVRGGGRGPQRLAECLVGDASGTVVFTAKNEQGAPTRRATAMYPDLCRRLLAYARHICQPGRETSFLLVHCPPLPSVRRGAVLHLEDNSAELRAQILGGNIVCVTRAASASDALPL